MQREPLNTDSPESLTAAGILADIFDSIGILFDYFGTYFLSSVHKMLIYLHCVLFIFVFSVDCVLFLY